MNEFEALTASIGEHAVDAIGRENIEAMRVGFNPRESAAAIVVALKDNSDEAQKDAIRAIFDVEQLFMNDAVISFHLVDSDVARRVPSAATPSYAYA